MRTHHHIGALAAALLLASCADYSVPDEVLNGSVVYTQSQPNFDFKPLNSYWLDPAAKVYENDANNPSILDLTNSQYAGIVNAVDKNLQALGYTKLTTMPPRGTTGATIVRLAVAKGDATYWYGGYWCDPYYYYYCSYDWYSAGTYKYGTVMMSISDVSDPDPNANIQIRWIAAMYGVASTPVYDIPRVADAINRSFGQSQYLDTH